MRQLLRELTKANTTFMTSVPSIYVSIRIFDRPSIVFASFHPRHPKFWTYAIVKLATKKVNWLQVLQPHDTSEKHPP